MPKLLVADDEMRRRELIRKYGLDAESIYEKVKKFAE